MSSRTKPLHTYVQEVGVTAFGPSVFILFPPFKNKLLRSFVSDKSELPLLIVEVAKGEGCGVSSPSSS
jgi:hypothetical protein